MTKLSEMIRELRRREAAVLEQEQRIHTYLVEAYKMSSFNRASYSAGLGVRQPSAAFGPSPECKLQIADCSPPTSQSADFRHVTGRQIQLARQLIACLNGDTFDGRTLNALRRQAFPLDDWFNPMTAIVSLLRRGEIERCAGGFRKAQG